MGSRDAEGHRAVDKLQNLFTQVNNDLNLIQHKLQREFQQTYHDNANPLKLVTRIKKIQDDLASLKEQCRKLLAAKQDLIDKTRATLVGNMSLLQRMQASSGLPLISNSDESAYVYLNQIIDAWNAQVGLKTGVEEQNSSSNDINQLLFSALVQKS